MFVSLQFLKEEKPGDKWKAQFEKTWPYYRNWYTREGSKERAGFLTSSRKLKEYMPEIYPIFEQLSQLAGGGDLASRFLTLYNPPAFMTGCTQVAWTKSVPILVRNYDYNPKLFEGVMLKSNWLQPVIGVLDCNWGLLDGINKKGLALSLTFGGRKSVGEGFGIPLIMRYVLETCNDVESAVEAFSRIPSHMVYNVTILDKKGSFKTVFLGPDRRIGIQNAALCTNHQEMIDWPEYAAQTGTIERESDLLNYLHFENPQNQQLINKFLHPPLYTLQPKNAYATLYTASYLPTEGIANIYWPGKSISQSFSNFAEQKTVTHLGQSVSGKLTL